jgi:cupin fold WbuC family metalloprotein
MMQNGLSRISLLKLDPDKIVEDMSSKTVSFFCRRCPVMVDSNLIDELKEVSRNRSNSNVRICLHDEPEAVHHDMVALERRDRYYRPHKHLKKGDTFHLIEGELGLFCFDNVGKVTDATVLRSGEIYRTAVNQYHAILPITEFVIHHENKPGPFEGPEDSIFPDWAPDGSDAEETNCYTEGLATLLNSKS